MSEPSTYIKLDRNIMSWEWYTDPITKAVFIHLLLTANIKDNKFSGHVIKRGELVTSYKVLAKELKFTESQVRTALNHLKKTGEIASKTTNKYSVITVLNYDKYQSGITGKSQADNRQVSGKSQRLKNIRNKEEKEKTVSRKSEPEGSGVSAKRLLKSWELRIPEQARGRFDTEDDWYQYAADHREEVEQWVT